MRRPSGTSAIPARAMLSGVRRRSDWPSSSTSPPCTGTRPVTAWSVVDLPAPFGPIKPTISPLPTRSDSSRTAGTAPYRTSRELTSSIGHGSLAQVGARHVEVGANLRRRPLGERSSLVEYVNAVADRHYERHVV